jgi:hypothetical protein
LFSLLGYSDQRLTGYFQLSTEGYCHWRNFLIRVVNGYGERRLPGKGQHVSKQKALGPGFGCWFLMISARPVTCGLVAGNLVCAEVCGYPEGTIYRLSYYTNIGPAHWSGAFFFVLWGLTVAALPALSGRINLLSWQ